jgi:6-phosphofructokinase 1
MDPKTGKTKVRYVDVATDSFKSARALQNRVEAADLADPKLLAALAKAANLPEAEVRTRYAPL